MAKFLCVCGYSISTSGEIPNPNEWRCLSDVDFGDFTGQVDAGALYRRTTLMCRCPQSGHLWIYWDGFDEHPSLYAPASAPDDAYGSGDSDVRELVFVSFLEDLKAESPLRARFGLHLSQGLDDGA
jgi:hypothetical protein